VPATGTSNWTALVSVAPGTNRLVIKARDGADHESAPVMLAIVYKPVSVLRVLVQGRGAVTPNLDNTPQEIGKSLALTAAPAPGWVFSNWTVGASALLSSKRSFIMESNLVITANFVTNRYLAAQAVFNGLAIDPNGRHHERSGFLTLKLAANG